MEKQIEILVDRKEYITKEEAYKAVNEQYHETGLDGYQDGIELMNRIAKIPAFDVVEVVRCRECIFGNAPCAMARYPEYFCADGKRKDGEQ